MQNSTLIVFMSNIKLEMVKETNIVLLFNHVKHNFINILGNDISNVLAEKPVRIVNDAPQAYKKLLSLAETGVIKTLVLVLSALRILVPGSESEIILVGPCISPNKLSLIRNSACQHDRTIIQKF